MSKEMEDARPTHSGLRHVALNVRDLDAMKRFNVGGAMLVKLLGRPRVEADTFDAKAGRVRDIGIAQATYARIFFVALTKSNANISAQHFPFTSTFHYMVVTADGRRKM